MWVDLEASLRLPPGRVRHRRSLTTRSLVLQMLQLLVAPLSGIEFQSSPLQSSRVHKRAEVRSAGKNLRLCPLHVPFLSRTGLGHASCAVGHQLGQHRGQHQARVVRQSADRRGAALRLADAGALLSCLASCVQVAHDVLVNYDKNANRWNLLDASIKADVVRAADVRLGCAPRPLSLHCAGRRCLRTHNSSAPPANRMQTSSSATSSTS